MEEIDYSNIPLENLAQGLQSTRRRERQDCAHELVVRCSQNPEAVVPYIRPLQKSLGCSEAQTRWEALNALALRLETLKHAFLTTNLLLFVWQHVDF